MAFPSVSAPLFVPAFPFDRRNSGLIFLRWVGGPILQLGAMPIYWIWSLDVLSPLCWLFWLMAFLLCPSFLTSGIFWWLSRSPSPLLYSSGGRIRLPCQKEASDLRSSSALRGAVAGRERDILMSQCGTGGNFSF